VGGGEGGREGGEEGGRKGGSDREDRRMGKRRKSQENRRTPSFDVHPGTSLYVARLTKLPLCVGLSLHPSATYLKLAD
jgi:hypothetical protein